MNIIFSCCSFICENHFPEILEVTVVQSGFSNCTKLLVLLCVYYVCVSVQKCGSLISEISWLLFLSFLPLIVCSILISGSLSLRSPGCSVFQVHGAGLLQPLQISLWISCSLLLLDWETFCILAAALKWAYNIFQ